MPNSQYLKLLSCKREEKYENALELAKMGGPAYQYMVQSLVNENQFVRACMSKALGNVGDENIIPQLIPLLNDNDEMVRFIVAVTLGNIGSKKAISVLENVCIYDNNFVKVAAQEAIRKIKK